MRQLIVLILACAFYFTASATTQKFSVENDVGSYQLSDLKNYAPTMFAVMPDNDFSTQQYFLSNWYVPEKIGNPCKAKSTFKGFIVSIRKL